MSEEYTVIHQWDKVKGDFTKLMNNPYEYVEVVLKDILGIRETGDRLNTLELKQDFNSVVDMLEKLNTIYTPKLKSK